MNKVLVIGGGIGGIQASLELANSGYYVYLIEKSSFLGGLMANIHKTYPVCFCCDLYPKVSTCTEHFNIEIITEAEVESVEGEAGNFKVYVKKMPLYVSKKCTACGICAESCPIEIESFFDKRKAIYLPHPLAKRYIIDLSNCLFFKNKNCRLCEEVCPARAINLDAKLETVCLEVGAILLAAGTILSGKQHYPSLPNVVSSFEFELLMKHTISKYGHLIRPSDNKKPNNIAWLQCVGSRDVVSNKGYCSSVCCMYALKEAMMARRYGGDIETTIFFIDIRTFGKDFEKYLQQAKEMGVKFEHCRFFTLLPTPNKDNVLIKYNKNGRIEEKEFNLVVLSVGLCPAENTINLMQKMGIELDQYHFVTTSTFMPVSTSRNGIYVCGTLQEPKDILETITQASAAAAAVTNLLPSGDKKVTKIAEQGEAESKIGIFFCNCQGEINKTIDIKEVFEHLNENLVVCKQTHSCLCKPEGRTFLKEAIEKHGLNRIIIAACTPRLYEFAFRETVKKMGINLIEFVNIREQCAWVHAFNPSKATKKAIDLINMAIAKINLSKPLKTKGLIPTKAALVVGGGICGLIAALQLAKQGIKVFLIEKTDKLGGVARKIHFSWKDENIKSFLNQIIKEVKEHSLIQLFMKTEVVETKGNVGRFVTKLKTSSGIKELKHGVTIIATGASEFKPKGYFYKKHSGVVTLLELEEKIAQEDVALLNSKNVVFIQCVGSRDKERPYCSRVCCTESLKNAIKLKQKNPDVNIYILFSDIRTYGLREDLYRKARVNGIVFIRHDVEQRPEVEIVKGENGKKELLVKVRDIFFNNDVFIKADFVVLATAIVASEENKKIANIFGIPLDEYGFFKEIIKKDLSIVDTPIEGIFVCGLAQGPKSIDESIAQALAAAMRAGNILKKKEIMLPLHVSQVVEENCDGCGYCIEPCPYNALKLIEYIKNGEIKKVAETNPFLCQGCGICQATCPKRGIFIPNYTLEEISAMIDSVLLPS